jgi:glycosyltransferase involved in cell wall biosynthesis
MRLKKVSVLLATYNGEKFLDQQIKSIFEQTYSNVKVIVRDDLSADGTLIKLKKWSLSCNNFVYYCNTENLGPADNFFSLLSDASINSDYFAFSDQDDIWHPDKLQRAVEKLDSIDPEVPTLYFSAVAYTDEDSKVIGLSALNRGLSFGNALIENVITGCTIVINKSAKDLILKNKPKNPVMHDAWLYLLMSCFGKIIYDEKPSVLYRQHSNNYFGFVTK